MELSPEDIEELRKLYQKEFKEELSPEDARAMATRLLELYLLLAQPEQPPSEKSNGE